MIVQSPLSSCVVRRQQFDLNDYTSYTPGPISIKLYRNVTYVIYQDRQSSFTLMNNMATRFKKIGKLFSASPPEPKGLFTRNIVGSIRATCR